MRLESYGTFLEIGIGDYGVGKSAEKIVNTWERG
jgi:hypothetical protein